MIVPVVNFRFLKMKAEREAVVYVGRGNGWAGVKGHPLANPFTPKKYPGEDCVVLFRQWLERHKNREALLADLFEEVTRGGIVRPLACWCVTWSGKGEPTGRLPRP